MPMATDDWPFLYTRQPTIPGLTLRGIGADARAVGPAVVRVRRPQGAWRRRRDRRPSAG